MTSMADVAVEESSDYELTFAYLGPGVADAMDGPQG
jgi:hypothetical protein